MVNAIYGFMWGLKDKVDSGELYDIHPTYLSPHGDLSHYVAQLFNQLFKKVYGKGPGEAADEDIQTGDDELNTLLTSTIKSFKGEARHYFYYAKQKTVAEKTLNVDIFEDQENGWGGALIDCTGDQYFNS